MKIVYTAQKPNSSDSLKRVLKSREFLGGEYTVELDTWWTSVRHNGIVIFAVQSRHVEEVTQ